MLNQSSLSFIKQLLYKLLLAEQYFTQTMNIFVRTLSNFDVTLTSIRYITIHLAYKESF